MTWSLGDDELVATCLQVPSLSWLANTQDGALHSLRDRIAEVVPVLE